MAAPRYSASQGPSTAWSVTGLCLLLLLVGSSLVPVVEAGLLSKGGKKGKELTKGNADEQIAFWRNEVQTLRTRELAPAVSAMYTAEAALARAKRKEGIFYTKPEDRATIRQLDEDYRRALVEVNTLKKQENMMLAKLKPLYGVLSTQFAQEQKESIAGAISTVQRMSYDNAWYSSLFSVGEAESISDVIVGFIVQFIVGYIVLYPFAVLYYAVFVAPWSVYQYMSGFSDIIPAAVAYLVSVGVMCLPLAALGLSLYLLYRKYGPRVAASMEEARRRQEQRQHYHRD